VTKKLGEKAREKKFQKTHEYGIQKMLEKNGLKKVRKHVFYKHMNIVTKK